MKLNEELIKAALIGTRQHTPANYQEIQPIAQKIIDKGEQMKEDIFLKSAFSFLLYEAAGKMPLQKNQTLPPCPAEKMPYLPEKTAAVLKEALLKNNLSLVYYIIKHTKDAQKVVPEELVAQCLEKAVRYPIHAEAYLSTTGELGKWLSTFNPEWQHLLGKTIQNEDNEELWQRGTLQQRVMILKALRKTQAQEALKKLAQVMPQESATNRQTFLEVLQENLSTEDEAFLMSLQKDKSTKVREIALYLLKNIENGQFQEDYLQHALNAIQIKEKKAKSGIKKTFDIDKAVVPSQELFSMGIDKISPHKNTTDEAYWLAQMLGYIHPEVLAQKLNLPLSEWIEILLTHKYKALFISAVEAAAIRFHQEDIARSLIKTYQSVDSNLLKILPENERWTYAHHFVDSVFTSLLHLILEEPFFILPFELAKKIFQHLMTNPYLIDNKQYAALALYFPKDCIALCNSVINKEEEGKNTYLLRHFKTQASEMLYTMEQRELLVF